MTSLFCVVSVAVIVHVRSMLPRNGKGLLPGLLQRPPHKHTSHGTLIVGGTTRIANWVSLLLRHSPSLAQQIGGQALTPDDLFGWQGTERRRTHTAQRDATVLTGSSGWIEPYGGSNAHRGVVVCGAW